jgi:archaellum component FlaC
MSVAVYQPLSSCETGVCDHSEELHVLWELREEVRQIRERMDKIEEMTTQVIADVKPTLDEVMQSSFMKMLGMKKKS